MNLWAVGKVIGVPDSQEWEFMGVFDSSDKAEAICMDRRYFVGPVELNKPFPAYPIEWPGGYYPKSDVEPVEKSDA
jgi:hypothetical protein